MLKHLTDDFEFDESKQKLKEYEVDASTTGTVSDNKSTIFHILYCWTAVFSNAYFKVAGSQIHLSCVEDEAVFWTEEMNAERIFVNCEPAESETDDALSNIQLSLYLFNGVSTIYKQ